MAGDIIRNSQGSILHKVHGSLAPLADKSTFQQLQHGDILQEWYYRERKCLWVEKHPFLFSFPSKFFIDFVLYKFIQLSLAHNNDNYYYTEFQENKNNEQWRAMILCDCTECKSMYKNNMN